jgi:hypothetical protein
MAKTVFAVMDSAEEVQWAVDELLDCGFERSEIGLMASQNRAGSAETGGMASATSRTPGSALGGVAGLVTGFESLAVPGLGPVIAAGPVAEALAGIERDAPAGGKGAGVVGALEQAGLPHEQAHCCAEAVRRGAMLITVSAIDDSMARTAADILQEQGAMDMNLRVQEWLRSGWSGIFEPERAAAGATMMRYSGPERRRSSGIPWTGVERRHAAMA